MFKNVRSAIRWVIGLDADKFAIHQNQLANPSDGFAKPAGTKG